MGTEKSHTDARNNCQRGPATAHPPEGPGSIPEHSKPDSLGAKGNPLRDASAKTAALKGANSSQISVMVQGDASSNDSLEKLAGEAQ